MPSEDVSRSAAGRLRATAHPTRLAILHLLGGHPALTATECAKLLGESPKTCSYHLHQLAAHGYVAEVPAAGRIRPWRLAPDHAAGPAERRRAGDRGVAARLRREESVLGGAVEALHEAAAAPGWAGVATVHHRVARMTAEELAAWTEDVERLTRRHLRRATPAPEPEDAARREVALLFYGYPTPPAAA
jgi:DNA-binding transcriptional ArsR family regulator